MESWNYNKDYGEIMTIMTKNEFIVNRKRITHPETKDLEKEMICYISFLEKQIVKNTASRPSLEAWYDARILEEISVENKAKITAEKTRFLNALDENIVKLGQELSLAQGF